MATEEQIQLYIDFLGEEIKGGHEDVDDLLTIIHDLGEKNIESFAAKFSDAKAKLDRKHRLKSSSDEQNLNSFTEFFTHWKHDTTKRIEEGVITKNKKYLQQDGLQITGITKNTFGNAKTSLTDQKHEYGMFIGLESNKLKYKGRRLWRDAADKLYKIHNSRLDYLYETTKNTIKDRQAMFSKELKGFKNDFEESLQNFGNQKIEKLKNFLELNSKAEPKEVDKLVKFIDSLKEEFADFEIAATKKLDQKLNVNLDFFKIAMEEEKASFRTNCQAGAKSFKEDLEKLTATHTAIAKEQQKGPNNPLQRG